MYGISNSVEERTEALYDISWKSCNHTHAENKGDGHKKGQNLCGNDEKTCQTLRMGSELEKSKDIVGWDRIKAAAVGLDEPTVSICIIIKLQATTKHRKKISRKSTFYYLQKSNKKFTKVSTEKPEPLQAEVQTKRSWAGTSLADLNSPRYTWLRHGSRTVLYPIGQENKSPHTGWHINGHEAHGKGGGVQPTGNILP